MLRFVGGPLGGREDRRPPSDARLIEALWDICLPLDVPSPPALALRALLVRYLPTPRPDGSLTYVYDHRTSAPNPNPIACLDRTTPAHPLH